MRGSIRNKLGAGLRIAAATLALSVAAGAASAQTLQLIDYPNEQTARITQLSDALVQPIAPFVGGDAGSTTAITQLGVNNYANSAVTGNGSLSVIQQGGSNNRAVQAIEGSSSALLLVQGGSNNSVVQASRGDRNLQLVGVSGNNNNVAYVQTGNDLVGALDVRNSQNSTVLAIQTPASGRFMMPSGLNGLRNQVVVVVPGRMYVMPR